ncbi:hypothetical protein [Pseudorhodoferax sp. Leaf274]|uniref:hypothetical protein n=1 Tax=Pseudorhodoferax sp. Leaf274 TaxID=1736318 RepID=UPI00070284AE|nr:hypothetical protein [Pseudorhodoferax sp. Leaf274]KQP37576.1 hypothetical protein ASF44_14635 [Pseudorhodoferax sp. Leaf274]
MTAFLIDPNVVALAIAIVVVGALLALLLMLTLEPTAGDRFERAAAQERAETDAMHRLLDRLDYDHRVKRPCAMRSAPAGPRAAPMP